eukprot:485863-Rhodomonas_salina.1
MGRIAAARGTAGRLGGPTLGEGELVFREVSLTLGTLQETFLRRRGRYRAQSDRAADKDSLLPRCGREWEDAS